MQEHQVDIVRLQFTQALVDGSFRFFIPVVRYPHFRHEENLLAVDTAFADGISYAFFVVVCLRRVDHPVTHFQCIAYATFAFGGRYLIDAVTHLRHFDAIVQFYCVHTLIILFLQLCKCRHIHICCQYKKYGLDCIFCGKLH